MRQGRWLAWFAPDQVSQIVVKNATVAVAGLVRAQSGVAAWGSKPEPQKIPLPKIQPGQYLVQFDHLAAYSQCS